jgi:hypothetical protein
MTRRRRLLCANCHGSCHALASCLALFGLATVILLATTVEGEARCKHHDRPPVKAYPYPWHEYYQIQPPCTSLDDCDRKAFGESGTRGRMGLGADPAHPEGPGNVSD